MIAFVFQFTLCGVRNTYRMLSKYAALQQRPSLLLFAFSERMTNCI